VHLEKLNYRDADGELFSSEMIRPEIFAFSRAAF